MTASADSPERAAELAANLRTVQAQLAEAASAAGRSPTEVTLIAVTKTWPASDVRLLSELGVEHVGENKVQELTDKRGECVDLSLTWHFIGQLQRNKAKLAVANSELIHSVDRAKLVTALNQAAEALERDTVDCLIQINLDPSPMAGRGGVLPENALELADFVASSTHVRLAGVMGVAPRGLPAGPAFEKLQKVSQTVRQNHPHAWRISGGMSHDFAAAIAAGATHVRMGAALLGQRQYLR